MIGDMSPLAAVSAFLAALPEGWKAISALIGSFLAGVAIAGALLGTQVSENTDNIGVLRDSVSVVTSEQRDASAKLDRAICLIELTLEQGWESIDPIRVGRLCP